MYRLRILSQVERSAYLPFALPHLRGAMIGQGASRFVTIGAESRGQAVGLLVAEAHGYGPRSGRVHSLAIAPEHRRRGIGRGLLEEAQGLLAAAGAQSLEGRYVPRPGECDGVAPLLHRCGWSSPEYCALLARTDYATLSRAPFLRHTVFSPEFEVFPWKELTVADRQDMARRQKEQPWYPEFLSPFTFEKEMIAAVSLGLRLRGEVVGWCISHPLSRDVLRCAKLYVRQDLQLRGRGVMLLARAFHESPASGFRKFLFDVALENTAMVGFVERRMHPYLQWTSYIMRATKQLDPMETQ
jgi:ribosomal protein S18 acetylase RimI-like enzyme